MHECYPHGFAQNVIDVPMYWRLPRGTVVQWSLRDLLQKRLGDFDERCERRHYEYVAANYLPRFLLGRCSVEGHCLPRPGSSVVWDTLSDAVRSLPQYTRQFFDKGIEFAELHCLGRCPDDDIRRLQQSTYGECLHFQRTFRLPSRDYDPCYWVVERENTPSWKSLDVRVASLRSLESWSWPYSIALALGNQNLDNRWSLCMNDDDPGMVALARRYVRFADRLLLPSISQAGDAAAIRLSETTNQTKAPSTNYQSEKDRNIP